MNKNVIIGIVSVLAVALIGGGIYFSLNNDKQPQEVVEPSEDVTVGEDNEQVEGQKILVTYFSVPETDDPNKEMTQEEENSTVIVDGEVLGNTQYVAYLISEYTGGDLYRIEPAIPYTTDHETLVDQALEEQNNNARPEIKSRITNFDDYDIIYIGYPNWWGDMPMIMYSFMELYDFEGKTVIPFNTHGGSGLSNTVNSIKNELSEANVVEDAFTLSRNNMENAPTLVEEWLRDINMINE